MVRFHLLSLPLPLISHTKQLPKIVTVDIRQTQNIFKYNNLYFTISSRCFIQTCKAILPAERKKKLPFGILWFRPAGGDLLQYGCYNSEVRRKQLQAIMEGIWSSSFLPSSVSSGEVWPLFSIPLILFPYTLPEGTSMQFILFDISSLCPFWFMGFFL